ncbi:MAG TPA: 3-deoxy-manno-octulosonate cytidylyltransferase [Magnetospirillum sp.]|jgi:3-deoxy-manno-octulosonate cytidylyltransferase (CMP-KDO synthetase)|nr:3-deoxy-manno-octulosonate cytidylyltransferase [Magnetospirillum sp.]
MRTVCVIPARMGSSRYPGKPLEPMLGLALVLHVWHRCRLTPGLDRVVIATCDEEIRAACVTAGAEVVMTADSHPGCVDRTVEAIDNMGERLGDGDFVLMVQGDEVMVSPEMCAAILDAYRATGDAVVNLATRVVDLADHDDPNCVKVCSAPDGRALFFSRSPIPNRVRQPDVAIYQQTGVIGFKPSFLRTFGALERTPLEIAEGIDMLRTLEHGYPIRIVRSETPTIGVDTPADLKRGEDMLRADPVTARYL